jgi:predicted metalloprotease with PDZ domain
VVVLAGLVHILYGDGIPERVNHRLGNEQSLVTVNGGDFAQFPNISDYVLTTETTEILSSPGKLGITLIDDQDSMHVSDFAPASPAKVAGIEMGDHIVSLNGMKVASVAELKTIMFDKQPNDHVQVTVLRDHFQGMREELQFEVKLY